MMRKHVVVLALAALLPACSHKGRLRDTPSTLAPARNISVLGEWVLATPTDSTAFVGARSVELSLQQSTFTITARYDGQAPVVVAGTAQIADVNGGPIRLTPDNITQAAGTRQIGITVGQPIEVVATAADNSMVFASRADIAAGSGSSSTPSSIWHRRDAARRAGTIESQSAGEVEKKKKKP